MMTAKRTVRVVLGVLVLAGVAICQTKAVRVHEPARRLALVIGNAKYDENRLENPEGDARLIAATLKGLGFDKVVLEPNLETLPAMVKAVRAFGEELSPNDLAFFYYSGHGQQAPGGDRGETRNYLLPTGYDWKTPKSEVEFAALPFERVRQMLQGAQLRVLVLDACRKYKQGKSGGGGGLAPTVAASGELIAYATEADAVATDEGAGAGIYAQELAGALRQSGVEVAEVFRNVMERVEARTEGAQHPEHMAKIVGRLYLNGTSGTIPWISEWQAREEAAAAWEAARGGGARADLVAFIETYRAVAPDLAREAAGMLELVEGMEFVWVPAGRFEMGSPEGEEGRNDDELRHEVRISRGFWIGKYEVTQGEWEGVMGENPSRFKGCGARCPVENVSWEDVQGFIRKLSGLESGKGYRYRLPTEAEWEYAARAGSAEATPEGELRILGDRNAPELDGQAWYAGNSGVTYAEGNDCSGWEGMQHEARRCGTHPVGIKRANSWGLHDMLGNVWEWVADWYGEYPSGTVTDPRGPWTGRLRVLRGGGWFLGARLVRSAARNHNWPGIRNRLIGFRLVRTELREERLREQEREEAAAAWEAARGAGGRADLVAFVERYWAVVPDFAREAEGMLERLKNEELKARVAGMEFVWVPAGKFEMGSPEGEEGRNEDELQHEVRISQGFWMGRYEVTQGEWEAVMGTNPSEFNECGARCPVECVSWEDVQGFIQKLNGLDSGKGYRYRLPTEAEWEYAARAGSEAARPGGDLRNLGERNALELDGQAWYAGNSGVTYAGGHDCSGWEGRLYPAGRCGTHPVGMKRANDWGLHGMLGNVHEWVGDWYYPEYPSGAVTDPQGPLTGSNRVLRGGSWANLAGDVRSASRGSGSPATRNGVVGFRLVRTE